jgi:uncharacterized protein
MRRSRIDYGRLVEGALRTVVRDVLGGLAKEGAPPPHHFYITFRTHHPGVAIPEFLRDRYPTDMTIVLQHQFWDLAVDEEGFAVTLSFNDQMQRLRIPFTAIKVFADPGVEFGLQFTLEDEGQPPTPEIKLLGGAARHAADEGEENPIPPGGAEIVTLDRFRKK